MSRKSLRCFVSAVLLSLLLGVPASAQTELNYHVWDPAVTGNKLPSYNTTTDRYYSSVQNLRNATGSWWGIDANLILYNDDASLQNYPFYTDYSSTSVLRSDTPGQKRSLSARDTALFHVGYLSELVISDDILISGTVNNGNRTNFGAIYVYGEGILTANKVTFSSNVNTTGYGYYGYGSTGGAISADQGSVLNIEKATFDHNEANAGGAIYMVGGEINGNGAKFLTNTALIDISTPAWDGREVGGGAVYITNYSRANLENADFSYNKAIVNILPGGAPGLVSKASGGAIYAEDSDLNLKGTSFVGNAATGYGGALFFGVSDGSPKTLSLGSFAGKSSEFSRNVMEYDAATNTGTANSIVFANTDLFSTTPVLGIINVNIDVEGKTNSFNMDDPMLVEPMMDYPFATRLDLRMEKIGEGTWNLSGDSRLADVENGTKINILEGTFRLNEDSSLHLESAKQFDSLTFANGTTFAVGNLGSMGNGGFLSTSRLSMEDGSTLQLHNALTVSTNGDASRIAARITGEGDLNKEGNGTLAFAGGTENYGGNLNVFEGTLHIDSAEHSFETSGNVEFHDSGDVANPTTLAVSASSQRPSIIADGITIGDNINFELIGIHDDTGTFVVLESKTDIQTEAHRPNGFANSTDIGVGLDYISGSFGISADRKRYEGTATLTWNHSDPAQRHGTFTLTKVRDYFNVASVLAEVTGNANWSDNSLTKEGWGTLELSAANTYIGDTIVNAGTLKVTNAQGTGRVGEGNVQLSANTKLELDFDGTFQQQITGDGKVVKSGNSRVVLDDTGNDYSGGTEIQSGILSVADAAYMGTGTLEFTGGTLLNSDVTEITQRISVGSGREALFDTPEDLTLSASAFDGAGGLRKTGLGTLIMNAPVAYEGTTTIEQGSLEYASMESLGRGGLVLHDGTVLENTASLNNNRNILLYTDPSVKTEELVGTVFHSAFDTTYSGVLSGSGKMIKTGGGTMTLDAENTFAGGIRMVEGTVAFSDVNNLGIGELVFDGGTLKNLEAIDDFNKAVSIADGSDYRFETADNLTISTPLYGTGGLYKSGTADLILTGENQYFSETHVTAGRLIVDGSTRSKTIVYGGAKLTGTGRIYNDVHFQPGSMYQWEADIRQEDSPALNVSGHVILDQAVFQPITAGSMDDYPALIDHWTVLKYTGTLQGDGAFAQINNDLSPFYDFELDYSKANEVRAVGYHRGSNPRGLSDAVAAGISIAQRRAYRQSFDRIDEDLKEGRYLGLRSITDRRQRGQVASSAHRLWADIYGRSTEFESTYHKSHPWQLNSFGVQVGYSFLSSSWQSMGLVIGGELPELKNYRDNIDASDGYLGLYYGQRFYGMWEFKGYIGGGCQYYKAFRNDTRYVYRTKYRGDSFETNFELARPFLLGAIMVRPHFGFNFEHATQQASVESQPSPEFRTYSGQSLSQTFFRIGIDLDRRMQRGDAYLGIAYSNMIAGKSIPSVYVYYPTANAGTTSYGSNLGQNIFTIRGGGAVYLDEAKSRTAFLNFIGDIYSDRAGGQTEFTFNLGVSQQF